jgi:hypothetical protein
MRRLVAMAANITLAASLPTAAGATLADDISTSISGYGTVGGTFTSDAHYAYIHNSSEFKGALNSLDVGDQFRSPESGQL